MAQPVIRIAETDDDFEQARELVYEYAAWLDVDLCFQGFDDEMANFASVYGPPRGRMLLAMDGADAAGCVGLRPLSATGEGEIKRLFVRPMPCTSAWVGVEPRPITTIRFLMWSSINLISGHKIAARFGWRWPGVCP
jgi:hypothetical protein